MIIAGVMTANAGTVYFWGNLDVTKAQRFWYLFGVSRDAFAVAGDANTRNGPAASRGCAAVRF